MCLGEGGSLSFEIREKEGRMGHVHESRVGSPESE